MKQLANPQIRSFTITPATVRPGESAQGVVDAFDPDNRTVTVVAELPVEAGQPRVYATTVLAIEDNPIPAPFFTEVDAAGNPVATPTLNFAVDPANPFRVTITANPL